MTFQHSLVKIQLQFFFVKSSIELLLVETLDLN